MKASQKLKYKKIGLFIALFISQIVVSAAIFNPLLLVIISVSFLASSSVPDNIIINYMRIFKFVMILVTALLGIYGFSLIIFMAIAQLVFYHNIQTKNEM
jgi:hypothetical protein